MSRKGKHLSGREYIINLTKWRGRMALIASLITLSFTLYGVYGGVAEYARKGWEISELFHWFTINSNCLTAFSAAMIIPYAAEGIRKKHFAYPRWVAMFHYSGMVCTTLTMVFALGFISWYDPKAAFGGYNLYLHTICPVMVIVSFFMVESDFRFTRKEAVMAVIPTLVYEAIYMAEVVFIGKENGGWEDLYHMTEFLPFGISALCATMLVLGISFLIRRLHNRIGQVRYQKLMDGLWPKDVNPVEINIEFFGLGRYMGKHADLNTIELPLDLITAIAKEYGLKAENLIKPYIGGFMQSLKEKPE